MIDLLELGDIAGVDVEIEAYARLAERRGRVSERLYVHLFRAMRLLLAGSWAQAEAASLETARLGERIGGDTNATQAHVLQMVALRRERGGLDALEGPIRECAQRFRAIPGWRCVLAHVHALTGRGDSARELLDQLTGVGFEALPLDGLWLGAITLLSETAATLREPVPAAALYDRLLPHAHRNVALGWVSACVGSAARYLGQLAEVVGHPETAAAHFEAAIDMNERMGAGPLLARTRFDYARLLLRSTSDGDRVRGSALLETVVHDARALDMPVLMAETTALGRTPAHAG